MNQRAAPRAVERKLKNRKKRFSKGRIVRVSDLVFKELNAKRTFRAKAEPPSWDEFFRKMLGLPDREGNLKPLIEGMLETTTGTFFLRMPETSWPELEEVVYKVAEFLARKRQKKNYEIPVRMREIV